MQIGMHFLVHGGVHGVGFRMSARSTGRLHRLTGWVRNLDDAVVVELKVFGDPDDLDFFRAWLHDGPPGASVSRVDSKPIAYEEYTDFEIID